VSRTSATREDVINLQDKFDKRLKARQAREINIFPIREEFYAQTFDELIRKITFQCAERGFLLGHDRDEIKITIQAFQTLYETSIAYDIRKILMAEQRKYNMQNKIRQFEEECESLAKEVERLDVDIDETIKRGE
jgi:dynein light intermediate chain, axonemal